MERTLRRNKTLFYTFHFLFVIVSCDLMLEDNGEN